MLFSYRNSKPQKYQRYNMNQTFQKINPMIPMVDVLPGGICVGQEITITGSTHINAARFSMNLQCGPNTSPRDDVALHATVDFFRRVFIRNSIQSMAWGVEENFGGMSLSPGQQFRMSILCEASQFVIVLNQVTYRMNHRIPFQRISHLTIDGDVIIHEISSRLGGYAMPPSGPYPSSGMGPVPGPYPSSGAGYAPNSYVQPNHNKGPMGQIGAALGGGVIGSAIAARSINPKKIAKHNKKMAKKALKYGLPIAGAGVGAYALSKAMHHGHHGHHYHHHKHSSSSSSSSSSSD